MRAQATTVSCIVELGVAVQHQRGKHTGRARRRYGAQARLPGVAEVLLSPLRTTAKLGHPLMPHARPRETWPPSFLTSQARTLILWPVSYLPHVDLNGVATHARLGIDFDEFTR